MKRPKLSMTTILTSLAIVTAIGGGFMALGDMPPWAGQERVAQIDRRQDLSELNDLDFRILALERDKATRRLSLAELNLLDRLKMQRKVLCAKLKVSGC